MGSFDINYGKLKGKSLITADYSYATRAESVQVSHTAPVHDDMRIAFRQLVPHLAFMCDEVESSKQLQNMMDEFDNSIDAPIVYKLDKYRVTSFKITGAGDTEGVVITGVKTLTSGKKINLTSPNMRWEDEYDFSQELRQAVEKCKTEILLYHEGKEAPEVQQSLFDQENGDGDGPGDEDEE